MKRMRFILATCSVAVGCSSGSVDDGEAIGTIGEALNGDLSTNGNLTRRTFSNTSEGARRLDTSAYYNQVRIGADGVSDTTISAGLWNLNAFIANYGFAGREVVTFYYNRGDLGIGREMHCVDRTNFSDQQIAHWLTTIKGATPEIARTYFASQAGVAGIEITLPFGADRLPTDVTEIKIIINQKT